MKKYLTEAEQKSLLNAAKTCACPLAQRDYWWMRLAMSTGMRVNEMSLLLVAQAEAALRSGWLVVLAAQRKGGKRGHEYLVTSSVRECLQHLLALQRDQAPPVDQQPESLPLLWGRDGKRLSVRSYQARLQHWARAAGLGLAVSPHWLRHTRAMNILRRSRAVNPLGVVQEALAHASIASTGIYTRMSREDYTAALLEVDGGRMPRAAARKQATQAAPKGVPKGALKAAPKASSQAAFVGAVC
jgi:site-specific recombinase XerC